MTEVGILDLRGNESGANHPMYDRASRSPYDIEIEIPPNVNPLKAQISFGSLAIVNLDRDLSSQSVEKRIQSLLSLSKLFHSPEYVSQGLKINIAARLLTFLSSDNHATCRKLSSQCIQLISQHATGRAFLLQSMGNYEKLASVVKDKDDFVRKMVHQTFANLAIMPKGVELAFGCQLFEKNIANVALERHNIQLHILDTCYKCIKGGSMYIIPSSAMQSDALAVFTKLAESSKNWQVVEKATQCIMMLCFFHECKILAVESNTLKVMMRLLNHTEVAVRAASTGALMSISILNEAKRVIIRENTLDSLGKLLDDQSDLVKLHTIKTIGNCAEDYRGKLNSAGYLEKVPRWN